VRVVPVLLGCGCLFAGGFAAALAADDNPPVPAPSTTAPPGTITGFVSQLVVACDREHWRVRFDLTEPARVAGRLDRRVSRAPLRFTPIRELVSRRLGPGSRFLELGTHPAGVYRVRLRFRGGTPAKTLLRAALFRAGCTNPPQPPPTGTLPTGPGPRA